MSQVVGLQTYSGGISAVTLACRHLVFIKCVQWTIFSLLLVHCSLYTACRLFSNVCRTHVLDGMKALTRHPLCRFLLRRQVDFRVFLWIRQSAKESLNLRQILAINPLGVVLFTESTIPKDFLIVKSKSPSFGPSPSSCKIFTSLHVHSRQGVSLSFLPPLVQRPLH